MHCRLHFRAFVGCQLPFGCFSVVVGGIPAAARIKPHPQGLRFIVVANQTMKNSLNSNSACGFRIWNRCFYILWLTFFLLWSSDCFFFLSFQVEVLTQAPRATTVHAIRFVCYLDFLWLTVNSNVLTEPANNFRHLKCSRSRKPLAKTTKSQRSTKFHNRKLIGVSKLASRKIKVCAQVGKSNSVRNFDANTTYK